jgi:hypothetical protein
MEIFCFLFLPMTVSGRRGGWRGQIEGEKRRELTYPNPSLHLKNFFGREGNINLT